MGIMDDLGKKMASLRSEASTQARNLGIKVPNIDNPTSVGSSLNGSISTQETANKLLDYFASSNSKNSIMMRGLSIDNIKAEDWTSLFPYKFILYEITGTSTDPIYNPRTEVILPITPQDLQITTPFASQVTPGSRGILEEHNGIVFKEIQFQGTTGILQTRSAYTLEDKSDQNIQAIFGGTIQAVSNFGSAIASVFPRQQDTVSKVEGNDLLMTGYYQFHLIRAFLETYAQMKSKPTGKQWRLGFQAGKSRVTYLLTPKVFTHKQSATSPMEITYSFSATAWGTVPDGTGTKNKTTSGSISNSIGDIQKVLNGIRNSRRVFESFKDIIRAVKTDYQTNIIDPMNNIILTMKEALSIDKTMADFPKELNQSMQRALVNLDPSYSSTLVSSPSAQATLRQTASAAAAENDPTASQGGNITTPLPSKPSVLDNIDITDSVSINVLPLTTEQQNAVNNVVASAFLTTDNNTVKSLITDLQEMADALESQAETQGPDSPAWDILYSTYETIDHMHSLVADNFYGTHTVSEQAAGASTLLDFYQGYAAAGGVNFNRAPSKFAIPFPFRTNLEWLARKYLDDPTRWIEIAAINQLQPPYVDEDGFLYSLIANGQGRQFNIPSAANLYVGQPIWIYSNNVNIQKRTIKGIQKITDSNYVITVDGAADMGSLKMSDSAKMKAYLPNTVNSQKLIYIPIDLPSQSDDVTITPITFIDETPEMLSLAKIDLLLDQDGDLAVSQDGFQNLAYGKQNIIQAAKMKLQTAIGSLMFHPEYGAGVEVGSSEADFDITSLMAAVRSSFAEDPRFQSVDSIEINREPGVVSMRITVTAASNQGVVPLDFTVTL